MYEDWAARDVHFMRQNRGLPQGTNSSGVIANYYLMPFDEALDSYARRRQLRWYRYNDDMRLLGANREHIRLGLRAIGQHLASLNLIQQGSKTTILSGADARNELFETRSEKVQSLISRIIHTKRLYPRSRRSILRSLDTILTTIRSEGKSDSKVLAMLYTAYGELHSDRLLSRWKADYVREPTRARGILNYVARFLRRRGQCRALISMLVRQRPTATDWELAQFLRIARRMRHLPPAAPALFRSIAHSKSANWFVRQQAILTIGWFALSPEIRSLGKLLSTEWDDEVRRAIITVLFLLPQNDENQLLRRCSRDLAVKVSRMANYAIRLRRDAQFAKSSLKQFKEPNEVFFADCFWRLYQIRWNKETNTRKMLNRTSAV
jgi:Reverse transcriptase (RNA-dependent DNA polymerase)